MTIPEFKSKFAIERIDIYGIDGHLYAGPLAVPLDINKNIDINDLHNKIQFEIIEYLNTHILTKDGTICHLGLPLNGAWRQGYALDLHTTRSTLIGTDEYGHTRFDTHRPPIAEDLFQLKYRRDKSRIDKIANQATDFLKKHNAQWHLDLIIPVPPSDTNRPFQPVEELAKVIGRILNLPVSSGILRKIKSTSALKSIEEPNQRREILSGAFDANPGALDGKNVLLFDDLYRSGETLAAATDVLLNKGKTNNVYVLTITKTRSKR